MDDRVEVALALGNGRGAVEIATEQLRAELDAARVEMERLRERERELMRERDAIEYQRDELLNLAGQLTRDA